MYAISPLNPARSQSRSRLVACEIDQGDAEPGEAEFPAPEAQIRQEGCRVKRGVWAIRTSSFAKATRKAEVDGVSLEFCDENRRNLLHRSKFIE